MRKHLTGLFFSPTGNTKKTVEEICKAMTKEKYKMTDLTLEKNRKNSYTFGAEDAVVIGVPVYGGRVPKCVTGFLNSLKGDSTAAVLAVTYGNRDYDDALLELCDILSDRGFIPVAGGAFIGVHSYTLNVGKGRPDAADTDVMRKFGECAAEIADSDAANVELAVKGNNPYRSYMADEPISPVSTDRCISCRLCTAACPVSAIGSNPKMTDKNKCIMCHACVRACPVGARAVEENISNVIDWLEGNFTNVRKEPEVFIGTVKQLI